ncbi:hypothetical protein WL00_27600 [Burkholderia cepacia]|nr:hypothetical protein WL00_27600 [Burkholderia cepacia]KVX72180.1 hypothetical protein WL07_13650 [Burkholderia cepacia]
MAAIRATSALTAEDLFRRETILLNTRANFFEHGLQFGLPSFFRLHEQCISLGFQLLIGGHSSLHVVKENSIEFVVLNSAIRYDASGLRRSVVSRGL